MSLPFEGCVCIMVGMKFYKIVFIYIIAQLFCSPFAFSSEKPAAVTVSDEEVQKVKKELDARYEAWSEERRENYAPGWDDKIQDVQIRANGLLIENERLAREQQALLAEYKRLEADLQAQKSANEALREKIDAKRTLLEDKRWKEKANAQLKEWQKTLDEKAKELESYNRQLSSLDKKTELGRLKLISLGVDVKPIEEKLEAANEIERLREQIAEADDRERVLRYKLEQMIKSDKPLDPKVAALKDEIDTLNAKIGKAERSDAQASQPEDELTVLLRKKEELQKENARLQAALEKIEHDQTMGIANQRIKDIVDEMSEVDRQNNELKEEMEALKENIIILRSHVKRLEYQTEAVNAMKGNMGQMENLKNPF
jgi:chromosome segregation ATPase